MNTDTNELFYLDFLSSEQRAELEKQNKGRASLQKAMVDALAAPVIQPVPDELAHAAKLALGNKDHVVISKTSGGKLSRWAAQQRKARRKAAKLAKKRNRK